MCSSNVTKLVLIASRQDHCFFPHSSSLIIRKSKIGLEYISCSQVPIVVRPNAHTHEAPLSHDVLETGRKVELLGGGVSIESMKAVGVDPAILPTGYECLKEGYMSMVAICDASDIIEYGRRRSTFFLVHHSPLHKMPIL